jgi:hypothetical protein
MILNFGISLAKTILSDIAAAITGLYFFAERTLTSNKVGTDILEDALMPASHNNQ